MNKEVEAYETVDVAEVRKDDEGRFDGYGFLHTHPYTGWDSPGWEWGTIVDLNYCKDAVVVRFGQSLVRHRKSSLKSARRRVEPKPEACGYTIVLCKCDLPKDHSGQHRTAPPAPPKQEAEPEVKPGTWKHLPSTGYTSDAFAHNCLAWKCQVRRSDGRDHADERRGERRKGAQWVVKVGSKVKAFGWGCALRTYDDANLFVGEELLVTSLHGSNPSDISVVGQGGEYDIHIRNLDLVDRRKSDRRKATR
jgi:hypothetical protein